MIAKHGRRYLTNGGSHELPEGGHWKPDTSDLDMLITLEGA